MSWNGGRRKIHCKNPCRFLEDFLHTSKTVHITHKLRWTGRAAAAASVGWVKENQYSQDERESCSIWLETKETTTMMMSSWSRWRCLWDSMCCVDRERSRRLSSFDQEEEASSTHFSFSHSTQLNFHNHCYMCHGQKSARGKIGWNEVGRRVRESGKGALERKFNGRFFFCVWIVFILRLFLLSST